VASILDAVEREADRLREEARAEAARYTAEAKAYADGLVAERQRRIAEVSAELLSKSEAVVERLDDAAPVRQGFENLVRALGDAAERLAHEPSAPSHDFAPPPFHDPAGQQSYQPQAHQPQAQPPRAQPPQQAYQPPSQQPAASYQPPPQEPPAYQPPPPEPPAYQPPPQEPPRQRPAYQPPARKAPAYQPPPSPEPAQPPPDPYSAFEYPAQAAPLGYAPGDYPGQPQPQPSPEHGSYGAEADAVPPRTLGEQSLREQPHPARSPTAPGWEEHPPQPAPPPSAPGWRDLNEAKMTAIQMATSGATRGGVRDHLERARGILDATSILDEIFGSGSRDDTRVPWAGGSS
jgi:hypothetical protein